MNKRQESRRRTLSGLLFSDPYRKVVALALALALWFYLDNQVSDHLVLTLALQEYNQAAAFSEPGRGKLAVPIPTGLFAVTKYFHADTGAEISNVSLSFRGPKSRIQELSRGHHFGVRPRELVHTVRSMEFGLEDLVGSQEFLDMVDEMDPPRVRVGLELIADFQVKPVMEGGGVTINYPSPQVRDELRDRLRLDRAVLSPPTVVIQGPQSKISSGDWFAFETGEMRIFEDHVRTDLRLISADPDVRMSQSVLVTIPIDPVRTRYVMEIPVVVNDGMMPEEQWGQWIPESRRETATIEAYGVLERRYLKNPEERKDFPDKHLMLVVSLEESDKDLDKVVRQATLVAHDLDEIDPMEYQLEGVVMITLHRNPQ